MRIFPGYGSEGFPRLAGKSPESHATTDEIPSPGGYPRPRSGKNRAKRTLPGGKMGSLSLPGSRRTVPGAPAEQRFRQRSGSRAILHSRVRPDQGRAGGGNITGSGPAFRTAAGQQRHGFPLCQAGMGGHCGGQCRNG